MKEVLYEESINPINYKFQKTIYVIYSVVFFVNVILAGLSLLFGFFDISFLITAVFFGVTAFLFWFLRGRIYYCVDCIFVSGSTRLIKVINYKRRKKILLFEANEVEQVGKITSESFSKLFNSPGIKKVYATPNRYIEEGFYVFVKQSGADYLIIMDCKEEYLLNLVSFTGKKVIERDYK